MDKWNPIKYPKLRCSTKNTLSEIPFYEKPIKSIQLMIVYKVEMTTIYIFKI